MKTNTALMPNIEMTKKQVLTFLFLGSTQLVVKQKNALFETLLS